MKKLLKPIALLLALLMVLPLFACANDPGDGDESKKPVSSSSSSESSSQNPAGKDESEMTYLEKLLQLRDTEDSGLPDEKFSGNTIRIDCLYDENRTNTPDWIMKEEITADQINNALYKRHTDIETQFDVDIEYFYSGLESESSIDDYIATRVNIVRSGTHDIDIIGIVPWATKLMLEGIFEDMNDLDYIDFSRPWWFTDTVEDFTIDGHATLAFGSCTPISIFGSSEVCFFNKELCEELVKDENGDPVDLYQLVRDGKWTCEELYKIAKTQIDMNGNEKQDEGDIVGFMYAGPSFMRIYWNLGGKYCERDETGTLTCNLSTALNEKIFNTCRNLINANDKDCDGKWFADGNMMMYGAALSLLTESGGYDFEVGVLPLPKLDDNQKNYISTGYLTGVGITIDATDANVSACILEALSYYGWYSVVPTYYETIIKFKYSSDPQNAEMLDLMFNTMVYDPIYVFSKETIYYISTYCSNTNTPFASFIKRKNSISKNEIKQNLTDLRNKYSKLFQTK